MRGSRLITSLAVGLTSKAGKFLPLIGALYVGDLDTTKYIGPPAMLC
jgi:hypothetical protein